MLWKQRLVTIMTKNRLESITFEVNGYTLMGRIFVVFIFASLQERVCSNRKNLLLLEQILSFRSAFLIGGVISSRKANRKSQKLFLFLQQKNMLVYLYTEVLSWSVQRVITSLSLCADCWRCYWMQSFVLSVLICDKIRKQKVRIVLLFVYICLLLSNL